MPAGYESIKEQFLRKGYSVKEAKKHAARIWNASKQGKRDPVYPGYEKKHR